MFGALTYSLSFAGSSSGSQAGLLSAGAPPKKTPRISGSGSTSLNYLSRAAISLEYASLRYQSHCPLGMYVIPFAEDPSIWDAILFIHQGEFHRSRIHLRNRPYTKSFRDKAITPTPS